MIIGYCERERGTVSWKKCEAIEFPSDNEMPDFSTIDNGLGFASIIYVGY